MSAAKEITAGMKFVCSGGVMEVVEPNPRIEGDWFCRSTLEDTGLWSFSPDDILQRQVRVNEEKPE